MVVVHLVPLVAITLVVTTAVAGPAVALAALQAAQVVTTRPLAVPQLTKTCL
jgi:hypothetical protein